MYLIELLVAFIMLATGSHIAVEPDVSVRRAVDSLVSIYALHRQYEYDLTGITWQIRAGYSWVYTNEQGFIVEGGSSEGIQRQLRCGEFVPWTITTWDCRILLGDEPLFPVPPHKVLRHEFAHLLDLRDNGLADGSLCGLGEENQLTPYLELPKERCARSWVP